MKKLIFVFALLLSGCNLDLTGVHVKRAIEFCGSADNIWDIQTSLLTRLVTCTDRRTLNVYSPTK